MLTAILAQAVRGGAWGWSFGELAIACVILIAVFSIAWVAARAMNVPIPGWVMHILGIVIIACVAIVAIKVVLSM